MVIGNVTKRLYIQYSSVSNCFAYTPRLLSEVTTWLLCEVVTFLHFLFIFVFLFPFIQFVFLQFFVFKLNFLFPFFLLLLISNPQILSLRIRLFRILFRFLSLLSTVSVLTFSLSLFLYLAHLLFLTHPFSYLSISLSHTSLPLRGICSLSQRPVVKCLGRPCDHPLPFSLSLSLFLSLSLSMRVLCVIIQ